jgi:hypothetical protein
MGVVHDWADRAHLRPRPLGTEREHRSAALDPAFGSVSIAVSVDNRREWFLMKHPLLRKVDAVTVRVPDLDSGIAFYVDRLGHTLN